MRRSLSTGSGGLQLSSCTVTLDDTDRALRSLYGVTRLKRKKLTVKVVDHAVRLVEGEPYRLWSGVIADHGPEPDFTYRIEADGLLGRHSRKVLTEKLVPQNRLSVVEFPALAERWEGGWSPPIGYGELSDETATTPQGIVPGVYVGTANFQDVFGAGAISKVVDFYVFFGHAVYGLINLYYNLPDVPESRVVIPDSAFAVGTGPVWAPFKANWSDTGLSENWADYPSTDPQFRYTFVAVDNAHELAEAGRNGNSQLTGNWRGIEDVGDGSGKLLVHPAYIFQHFWTNFVENSYTSGDWFDVPTFGSYSVIDTDRITDAQEFETANSLYGAILIGSDGEQEPVFDVLKTMCSSWDLDIGETRHGQIFGAHEDTTATGTVTLTDQHDITELRIRTDQSNYYNVVRYRFGYRYVPPAAPTATPAEGDPLPVKPLVETTPWQSGLLILKHSTAIAANGDEEIPIDVDMHGVRDYTTAYAIATRLLNRGVGPQYEGPIDVEMTGSWNLLGSGSDEIELGSVIKLTHAEGLGSSGFSDVNVRITDIDYDDVLQGVITLRGRVLG